MNKFIINMLGGSEDVSHKRTIALLSWVCLLIILVFDLIGVKTSEYLTYIFAGMAGFSSTLSVIDKTTILKK